jgi:hypothetical protein
MVHYQSTATGTLERVGKQHNDGQPKGGASDSRKNRRSGTKSSQRPAGKGRETPKK